MKHLVLLGDSILDNQVYVEPGPAVVEQMRSLLPNTPVTLLAVDGSITAEVTEFQLPNIPADATHLVISSGGNDALREGMLLMRELPSDALETLERLTAIKAAFEQQYSQMLETALASDCKVTLCTIYDACPVLDPGMQQLAYTVLPMFNDCITRQAFAAGLPLLDLRLICSEAEDFAAVSPIEPSVQGGEKICDRIAQIVQEQNFRADLSRVYV